MNPLSNRELLDIIDILDDGIREGSIPVKYAFQIALLVKELKGYMGIGD